MCAVHSDTRALVSHCKLRYGGVVTVAESLVYTLLHAYRITIVNLTTLEYWSGLDRGYKQGWRVSV